METFIVVVLDESGSMSSQKADVIGGYNEFIREQQKLTNEEAKDKVNISLLKFNSHCNWIYKGIGLDSVRLLEENDYIPSHSTALFDAVAVGIKYADEELKKSAKDGNKRVLVVIMTDGENNSSRYTTAYQVRRLISDREERGNWTFTYIGENPDEWIKLSGTRDVGNIIPQMEGHQRANFQMLSEAVRSYRNSSSAQPPAIMQLQQQQMGYTPSLQPNGLPRGLPNGYPPNSLPRNLRPTLTPSAYRYNSFAQQQPPPMMQTQAQPQKMGYLRPSGLPPALTPPIDQNPGSLVQPQPEPQATMQEQEQEELPLPPAKRKK